MRSLTLSAAEALSPAPPAELQRFREEEERRTPPAPKPLRFLLESAESEEQRAELEMSRGRTARARAAQAEEELEIKLKLIEARESALERVRSGGRSANEETAEKALLEAAMLKTQAQNPKETGSQPGAESASEAFKRALANQDQKGVD